MKFPNYLIVSLAIVGAFSLVIMACSADSNNNANNVNNVNTAGKYQISTTSNAGGFFVLDTETGLVKTFQQPCGNCPYVLTNTTITQ